LGAHQHDLSAQLTGANRLALDNHAVCGVFKTYSAKNGLDCLELGR
jgi:hypothetical protein